MGEKAGGGEMREESGSGSDLFGEGNQNYKFNIFELQSQLK